MDQGKLISFGEEGIKMFGGRGAELLGVWFRGALKKRRKGVKSGYKTNGLVT